jgi:hypothetical protein
MNAFTICKYLPGQRRGALNALPDHHRVHNGKPAQDHRPGAGTGCEAIALVAAHKLGDLAPKVAA